MYENNKLEKLFFPVLIASIFLVCCYISCDIRAQRDFDFSNGFITCTFVVVPYNDKASAFETNCSYNLSNKAPLEIFSLTLGIEFEMI